ncbi:hypothetical protein BJ508DRAFT_331931 [Ascobolus immersus RN42]|uniref:Uncharacterized protein n=1 Tax=Ascobolus immersus RN42 TaxID=1160509 RepID=A0A3N4I157_ASCIM|nr:hypothetical protein BJ508DRAFT_331931 [Ascobolus immersus RN42]
MDERWRKLKTRVLGRRSPAILPSPDVDGVATTTPIGDIYTKSLATDTADSKSVMYSSGVEILQIIPPGFKVDSHQKFDGNILYADSDLYRLMELGAKGRSPWEINELGLIAYGDIHPLIREPKRLHRPVGEQQSFSPKKSQDGVILIPPRQYLEIPTQLWWIPTSIEVLQCGSRRTVLVHGDARIGDYELTVWQKSREESEPSLWHAIGGWYKKMKVQFEFVIAEGLLPDRVSGRSWSLDPMASESKIVCVKENKGNPDLSEFAIQLHFVAAPKS